MKNLIDIIVDIKKILTSLEKILNQEHNNLLSPNKNLDSLKIIIEKKRILFEKYFILNKHRLSLEKRYNIFSPYKNNEQLKKFWDLIVQQCIFLKELNFKNKILVNKNLYLNQRFLELFLTHQKKSIYDINGNLKF